MPLQNRVTPLSELVADPARGLVYGNRGCLHDGAGRIRRRYNGRRWIACRLEFRGWHREPLMQPGRFTELFFLDEATAFAAGHRPCALCRREDYDRFGALWRGSTPARPAPTRSTRSSTTSGSLAGTREQRHHAAPLDDLPDGAFVMHDGAPQLVLGARAAALDGRRLRAPHGAPGGVQAELITPPSLTAILRAGWEPAVPLLHPSAQAGDVALRDRAQLPHGQRQAGQVGFALARQRAQERLQAPGLRRCAPP